MLFYHFQSLWFYNFQSLWFYYSQSLLFCYSQSLIFIFKPSFTVLHRLFYCINILYTDCRSKAVGVDNSVKTIPDAQLSSHYASGDHPASDGRLNNPRGWSGTSTSSWLQASIVNSLYILKIVQPFIFRISWSKRPKIREDSRVDNCSNLKMKVCSYSFHFCDLKWSLVSP